MKLSSFLLYVIFLLADICGEEEFEHVIEFYHKDVGIEKAEQIRIAETKALRRHKVYEPTPKTSEQPFPYHGGLLITLEVAYSVCGSALLSHTALVTAAQCWYDGLHQAVSFEVVLASPTLFYGGLRLTTSNVTMYTHDKNSTLSGDIAIVFVPYVPTDCCFIKPINLLAFVDVDDWDMNHQIVDSVGYGIKADSNVLSSLRLVIVSKKECIDTYGSAIVMNDTLCAKAYTPAGPCKASYGGPLVTTVWGYHFLVAINSFIVKKGCDVWPPVGFVNVMPYKKWIRNTIGNATFL